MNYIIAALAKNTDKVTYLRDGGKRKYWTANIALARHFSCLEHAERRLAMLEFRKPYLIEIEDGEINGV